jgi:hypothetical protein
MSLASAFRRHQRWIVSALLIVVGTALVWWAKDKDGWSQAWRVEIGAAIALLGPLYFLEEVLRGRVETLTRLLEESARSYGLIRRLLPAGDRRTQILDALLDAVKNQAEARALPKDEIARLARGDGETRTIALAAMQGDHDLIDNEALVFSISRSESGMEQYHALKLACQAWRKLPRRTKGRVVSAIHSDAESRKFIAADAHRAELAEQIAELARADGIQA